MVKQVILLIILLMKEELNTSLSTKSDGSDFWQVWSSIVDSLEVLQYEPAEVFLRKADQGNSIYPSVLLAWCCPQWQGLQQPGEQPAILYQNSKPKEATAQHAQVICIIDTKQHPAIQFSLQSGNVPFPSSSCNLFTPSFHPVRLPPTHPSPSFIPTQALSLSSHQKPDTSIASLHLSAFPATYLPLPQAERSMRNKDI